MSVKKSATFLINSLEAGGAERVLSLIVDKLSSMKINVRVICLNKNDFYTLPRDVERIYLYGDNQTKNIIVKIIRRIFSIWKLRCYINNRNIKKIQSHLFKANYLNIVAKLLGAGHTAQIVNTVAVSSKYTGKTLKGLINLFLIRILYPHADKIIYKSEAMAYDFKKQFPSLTKHYVIYNPYNFRLIKRLAECGDNTEKINVTGNTIISLGRLEKHKHTEMLITVFGNLLKNYPLLNLIILGDGPERKNLEHLIDRLKIRNKVSLMGTVKNPFAFLIKAGIYVSCSVSEGFPNALIEALACGLVTVSTDCLSGPREILAPGTNPNNRLKCGYENVHYGILFAENDSKALEDALRKLLSNRTLYNIYKNKNKFILKKYSIENIHKQYKKVLGI